MIDTAPSVTLEELWNEQGFIPNAAQREAIQHIQGPLYLPAGPGSGKTRVLLWRVLNLIVYHNVEPSSIYLATFTEKAAFQLQEGLRGLLSSVTKHTGITYDLSQMYIGTIHSLCQRLMNDRHFYQARHRSISPRLLDELDQFFFLYKRRRWQQLTENLFPGYDATRVLKTWFNGNSKTSPFDTTNTFEPSRFDVVNDCIAFFNRFAEEHLSPATSLQLCQQMPDSAEKTILQGLITLYDRYCSALAAESHPLTDFSHLQQHAYNRIVDHALGSRKFKHVIIDEYQDTNTIQEKLIFALSLGHKNLCVVSDDDQALYRFRGATVENFVQFPERCLHYLHVKPTSIALSTNYRSRSVIVNTYTQFMQKCQWTHVDDPSRAYRVTDKNIQAASTDVVPSVVVSEQISHQQVCDQVAKFVKQLIDEGKVSDANQIAFLFPSLKYDGKISQPVARMKTALENVGLKIYAPRAGRFLETEESTLIFGILQHIFGKLNTEKFGGADFKVYNAWLEHAYVEAQKQMLSSRALKDFVIRHRKEMTTHREDYERLATIVRAKNWQLSDAVTLQMRQILAMTPGIAASTHKSLENSFIQRLIEEKAQTNTPITVSYLINRATALDSSILDIFYQVLGQHPFQGWVDLAEQGEDEGPICNLGLISQYLARYMDEYQAIITMDAEDRVSTPLFGAFLFAIFRRSESEYEDADDPFPHGRIPFITIHQAKGLEFPVVVLGNLRKDYHRVPIMEDRIRHFISRPAEPLDRMAEFDAMRLFYVALSRAQNLLVLVYPKGQGISINEAFKKLIQENTYPQIPSFAIDSISVAQTHVNPLPKVYSYTSDYLLYQTCAKQYMIFRKYGFVPSRTQTMFFGQLIHRTMDDLHQFLIARRGGEI